jgi:hypothetical protein
MDFWKKHLLVIRFGTSSATHEQNSEVSNEDYGPEKSAYFEMEVQNRLIEE